MSLLKKLWLTVTTFVLVLLGIVGGNNKRGAKKAKTAGDDEDEEGKTAENAANEKAQEEAKTGETNATKTGKEVHKARADERRASGEYDSVNEALCDKEGNIIEVPKNISKRDGTPSEATQRAIPDAVKGPPAGQIIDDKPSGRPINKDYQEMRRNIEAYETKYGEPPKEIRIERYNPATGAPAGVDIYTPKDFGH